MKINVNINKEIEEPIISIETPEVTSEITEIIKLLNNNEISSIDGYLNDEVYILRIEDIENIFTEENYIYTNCNGKKYRLKEKLYSYEELLKGCNFIQISKSEIINLNKVIKLNFSINGTILITLKSGIKTYCSRRRIKEIKQALNIK